MKFEGFSFSRIKIDGVVHERDVVIDRGKARKRKKKSSKQFRDTFGYTPLPGRAGLARPRIQASRSHRVAIHRYAARAPCGLSRAETGCPDRV